MGRWLQQRDLSAEPIAAGPTQVVPILREHALQLGQARFVWRRPVALEVTTDGRPYRVPIIDVTLAAACAAIAIGALFAILIRALANLGGNE